MRRRRTSLMPVSVLANWFWTQNQKMIHWYYPFSLFFSAMTLLKVNYNNHRSWTETNCGYNSQANFAKWEPWHGKFGLNYPWHKYLQIGELLRELAATVISIKACLQSPRQVYIKSCFFLCSTLLQPLGKFFSVPSSFPHQSSQ